MSTKHVKRSTLTQQLVFNRSYLEAAGVAGASNGARYESRMARRSSTSSSP